ncbi:MAG: hypothetical protein ABI197_07785 [Granulicella sp.]
MRLAIEIVAIYSLYITGVTIILKRYGKKDTLPMIVAAGAIPVLVVVSFFEAIFLMVFRSAPRVRPCPEGLDVAEMIVERHRQEMFGGETQHPKFAFEWARVYALTLERETKTVKNFARSFLPVA